MFGLHWRSRVLTGTVVEVHDKGHEGRKTASVVLELDIGGQTTRKTVAVGSTTFVEGPSANQLPLQSPNGSQESTPPPTPPDITPDDARGAVIPCGPADAIAGTPAAHAPTVPRLEDNETVHNAHGIAWTSENFDGTLSPELSRSKWRVHFPDGSSVFENSGVTKTPLDLSLNLLPIPWLREVTERTNENLRRVKRAATTTGEILKFFG